MSPLSPSRTTDSQTHIGVHVGTALAMVPAVAEDSVALPADGTKVLTSTPPSSVQSPCHSSPLLQLKAITSENSPSSSNQAPRPRKLLLLGEKKEPTVWSADDEGGGSPQSSKSFECRGGASLLDASFASPLSKSLPSSCSAAFFGEFADDSRFSDEPGTPPGASISSTCAVPKAPRKNYKARPAPLRKKQPQKLFFGKEDVADQSGNVDPTSTDGGMTRGSRECGPGSSMIFASPGITPVSDSVKILSRETCIGSVRAGLGVCVSPRSPQSGTALRDVNANYHEYMPQVLSTTEGMNEFNAELSTGVSRGTTLGCGDFESPHVDGNAAFMGMNGLNALLPHTPQDRLFNSFSRSETPKAPRKLHRPVKREQDWG